MRTIAVPMYPGTGNSLKFDYRYQFHPSENSLSKPVVIYLPGGPGMTSISQYHDSPFAVLPPGLPNRIYTDQRGTGCNGGTRGQFQTRAYTGANFANDIVELIKDVQKQGYRKYILYGHSFGTYHASKVVDLINQINASGANLPRPEVLVLEGTFGRSFQAGESEHAYMVEWMRVKKHLSKKVKDLLLGKDPLGISQVNWGYFIMNSLYLGRTPDWFGAKDLGSTLMGIHTEQGLQVLKRQVNDSVFQGFFPSFNLIMCQELSGSFMAIPGLKDGNFDPSGNQCRDLTLDHPFDVKNMNLQVPVVYFQGTKDAATPLWQAYHHYAGQKIEYRSFVKVVEAGHNPLQTSLWTCKPQIWNDLVTRFKVDSSTIENCKWDWEIVVE